MDETLSKARYEAGVFGARRSLTQKPSEGTIEIEVGDLYLTDLDMGKKMGMLEQNDNWRMWGCWVRVGGKLAGIGSCPLGGDRRPPYGWMALPEYKDLVLEVLNTDFW